MKNRVITSIVYVLVLLALCAMKWLVSDGWGALGFDAAFCVLAILASLEFLRAADKKLPEGEKFSLPQKAFTVAFCAVAVPLYVAAEMSMGAGFLTVACAFCVYVLFLTGLTAFKHNENGFKNTVTCIFAMLYCGVLAVVLSAVNHLEYNSLAAILLLFIGTMFTDGGAFIVGSLFKKVAPLKLAPQVSPNKTVVGAAGGIIGGMAGGLAAYYIAYGLGCADLSFATQAGLILVTASANLAPLWFVLAGLVVSVVCQLGDLFESALKRECGVKDTGKLLPGHGGVLDRFDGVLFAGLAVLLLLGTVIA